MNLTTSEIRDLIKIARRFPDMSAEDIINSIIEGYNIKTGLKALASNITYIVSGQKPILRPTLHKILIIVCSHHGLLTHLVMSKSRETEFVRARQQFCLIGTLFRYSQESISNQIKRDHATAFHGKSKALKFCVNEIEYMDEVARLISKFPRYKISLSERLEVLIENSKLRQYGT